MTSNRLDSRGEDWAFLHLGVRIAILFVAIAAGASCRGGVSNRASRADAMSDLPHVILWAWERRENLDFIDPSTTAVAYLSRSLDLHGDGVASRPRFQPLTVPPRTKLIAVVRIESDRRLPPTLSVAQRAEAARIVAELARGAPAAIQIDFDATRSERTFYRDLLADVRSRVPSSIPLSMTALASWCLDDDWISDLPVDEAVPMIYRMGRDSNEITAYLRAGGEFRAASSRNSIGLSLDAELRGLSAGKRVYLFSPHPWTVEVLSKATQEIKQ